MAKNAVAQKTSELLNKAKNADQIFTPAYKTEDAMLKALDGIVKAEATVRDTIQDVMVSALAHHEACLDKGGSVQTTLTKVYNKLATFKSVNQRMITTYLRAVLGPNLTYKEEKGKAGILTVKKGSKLAFHATIKQEDGEYHYSERKFWELDANAAELKPWSFIAAMEALLKRFDDPDALKRLGKPKGFDQMTEITVATAVRDLVGIMKPDPEKDDIDKNAVKDLTRLASKIKAEPTILHATVQ